MIFCKGRIPSPLFLILLLIALSFFPYSGEAKVFEECVYLIPAGKVDKKVLEKLKEKLPGLFPMSVKAVIDPEKEIPQAAYDPSRKQYDAQAVLDDISGRINLALTNERALIVTDADLYVPDLNFVFGLADAKKGICIISLARLKNEFDPAASPASRDGRDSAPRQAAELRGLKPDERLLFERALKEAAHELGHSWKIDHCPSPKCVMFFSNSLADTDKKRESFCYKCRIALENRSGGGGLFGKKAK